MSVIDEHLDRFDDPQRSALSTTADIIRVALPGAVEVMSYGMPTFKLGGENGPAIIGLDGFTRHNSLFPYSGSIPQEFAAELADYPQTKGSIHFDLAKPFPRTLLRRILKARLAEINASYPKKSGEYRAFHSNGFPKVVGRMRGDRRVGTWTTYDRSGEVRSTTTYS